MRLRTVRLAACMLFMAALASAQSPSFKVIVHATNPTGSLSKQVVSDMFLKRAMRWDHGERVRAFDLPERSPVRDAFSLEVHGRRAHAIGSYWRRLVFSGREIPIEEVESESAVIAAVRTVAGAVGYVSADARLGDGVKVLEITE